MHTRSILVLYPTVEEARLALDPLGDRPAPIPNVPSSGGMSDIRYSVVRCPDSFLELDVYFAVCGTQSSAIKSIALKLIRDIQPTLVILPGIAGGGVNCDAGVGDVVFSDTFLESEREKQGLTTTGIYNTVVGEFGRAISVTKIPSDVARSLHDIAARAQGLSNSDLVEGATRAGVPSQAIAGVVSRAKRHFARLVAEGPKVVHAAFYSGDTNWQKTDNPLSRLHPYRVDLEACEMEARFVADAMRQLGRKDNPLLIKVISDVAGFHRSETVKDIAREEAAVALRSFLQHDEFILTVQKLPPQHSFNSRAAGEMPNAAKHLEIELGTDAPEDEVLRGIANAIRRYPEEAAACADLQLYYLDICPRCGNGDESVSAYSGVMRATYDALAKQRCETVRAAQLLMPISVFDPTIAGDTERLSVEVVSLLRRNEPSIGLQRAACGLLYQLMAVNPARAYQYWNDLRATTAFSDETLGNWLFTMLSARVSAGSAIDEIKYQFKRDWDRFEVAAAQRNPHSAEIMELIPILDDVLGKHTKHTRKQKLAVRKLVGIAASSDARINQVERLTINTVAAARYGADHVIEAVKADAAQIQRRKVQHVPLVPLTKLFSAIAMLQKRAADAAVL